MIDFIRINYFVDEKNQFLSGKISE